MRTVDKSSARPVSDGFPDCLGARGRRRWEWLVRTRAHDDHLAEIRRLKSIKDIEVAEDLAKEIGKKALELFGKRIAEGTINLEDVDPAMVFRYAPGLYEMLRKACGQRDEVGVVLTEDVEDIDYSQLSDEEQRTLYELLEKAQKAPVVEEA